MRAHWLVLLVLLPGCVDGPDDVAPGEIAQEQRVPESYQIVCPPEGVKIGEICSYRIESQTESIQEPFVAVHPDDPDIVAIGVNAGHTTNGISDHGGKPGFDMVRLDVYITSDGGTTWTLSTLPYVADPAITLEPVETTVVGDPALQFDETGTLHLSGIASNSQVLGYNVFYTQTTDLGETWATPTVLSTKDDNDRNWLNIGPDGTIYVPWQRVGSFSEIAWSTDGGSTWNTQDRSQVAKDCITVSEMTFFQEEAMFACTDTGDNGYQVVVYGFDTMTGAIQELSRPTGMNCLWPKIHTGNNILFLAGEGCDGHKYSTSLDGQNWSNATPMSDIAVGDIMWQTDDAWGRVHFLMADGAAKTYVVYDPTAATILQTQSLPSDAAITDPPTTVAPAYGDHYWGIDVTQHGGALVWTRDDGLDVSFLMPVVPDLGAL